MALWSNLPHHLTVSIAKRLIVFEDYIAFGAVCKSWKSAATKENFTRRHQVPLLMLPEKEGTTTAPTVREFYNLKNGKVFELKMPELVKEKLCYSSLGWLMTQSDKDSKLNLLHPLNHAHIALPDVETFKKHHLELFELKMLFGDFIVRKFVLSSSPSRTSDYIVMIHSWERLAFCRPGLGDQQWYIIDPSETKDCLYFDITYYKGKFYVMDNSYSVFVCEIEDPMQAKTTKIVPSMPRELSSSCCREKLYLVEAAGDLLVVLRSFIHTTEFKVFKVPLRGGSWSEVKRLGNRSLFLGYNSSFSVKAPNYPGCKPNCIYFTNHPPTYFRSEEEYKDMGIYNMEDGKLEPHLGKSPNFWIPHLWVEPSF